MPFAALAGGAPRISYGLGSKDTATSLAMSAKCLQFHAMNDLTPTARLALQIEELEAQLKLKDEALFYAQA